jgi:hypothetical protein
MSMSLKCELSSEPQVYLSGNDLGLMGARHLALVIDKSISLLDLDVPPPPPRFYMRRELN